MLIVYLYGNQMTHAHQNILNKSLSIEYGLLWERERDSYSGTKQIIWHFKDLDQREYPNEVFQPHTIKLKSIHQQMLHDIKIQTGISFHPNFEITNITQGYSTDRTFSTN